MNKSILSFSLGDKVQVEIARNLWIYGKVSEYVQNRADKLIVEADDGNKLVCRLDDLEKIEE